MDWRRAMRRSPAGAYRCRPYAGKTRFAPPRLWRQKRQRQQPPEGQEVQTDNINGLVRTRDSIEEYIITKISELSRDWDYDSPVTPQSRLFGELGLESLDAVVLATAIQEHLQRNVPFAELFAEI